MKPVILAAILALAVLACGGTDGPLAPGPTGEDDAAEQPTDETTEDTTGDTGAPEYGTGGDTDGEDGMEITGTLGGDAQLEGGCAWLDAGDGTRYEVLYPDGYRIQFDPVQLVDPDGEVVASEGDTLTVRGEARKDMASICQVGELFEAREVAPGA